MAVDLDLPVRMHQLTMLDEGDDVTVGRADIDAYCVLPADGAALLRELIGGMPPRVAAEWYEQAFGQPVDIEEFLEAMVEMEFVAAPGELIVLNEPVRWQRLGRALFSPVAMAGYALLLLAAVLAMIREPALTPHYSNLFFSPYVTVVVMVVFVGQFPFILLHESFHALAGRRLGLRSRMGIGRRLYFVVVETSLDGLVAVPRAKRYLPMLAGMLVDLVAVAVLTLVAAALRRPDGTEPLVGGICLAMAFATLLRFVWQFYFYLQTDLYHVIVTVFGCVDLQKTARRTIANRVNRLLGRRAHLLDETVWHPTDRAVARWYSWLLVVGYAFSIGTLLLAGIPATYHMFSVVLGHLSDGSGLAGVTDSVAFLLVNLVQFVALGYLLWRARRDRAPAPAHVLD
ncbi:hypothetical protein GCM10010168_29730 [Actinoplanes ianthinogenes]|uniref:Uncharacterized protein n=1 Tax=Actinoplanes ianthinogenes TaxID=122358 RepID=A0ABN6C3M7_9ACTN|nr:hypothetical protein [Actinoplanes ianthinogenes]BCJ40115.1 hypothetical protein Aiant_07720 [Actinoplanes ianthinogenes]GGR10360.1 hypothetical protein GCM10010168_29730 [Actinoplanes ianthinogenes]